ncbi:MAG: HD-GYP domain-containing protein [Gammaproteobacteria bacterium]|nr:HD-GYP domain-containing protein [Gammaproteobacteria bacterium]
MSRTRIKVDTADLDFGMYVAQLDRSWLETPFLFQGFVVRETSEIDQLRHYCRHVYVDVVRSSLSADEIEARIKSLGDPALLKKQPQAKPPSLMRRVAEKIARADPTGRLDERLSGVHRYKTRTATRQEAPKAAHSYNHAVQVINQVLEQVRDGRAVDVEIVREAVSPMIDSVLRNPDAMSWFVTLQKQDDYTYHHSIASSVWAVVLGRHLGFDRRALDKLAIGGMLLDVGKARISRELLQKPGRLSPHEVDQLCQHVDFSLDMVQSSPGISRDILDMIASHHERHDGSGYPQGLAGADIPVYGRIAGIVDCYDAMVSTRPYAPARSSYDAIRELNQLAGSHFQRELVEQFVQALGMFPTGSLVELNTGEVGIVIEQNRVRRLRPKVMLLLDDTKQPITRHVTLDLRKVPGEAGDPRARWIDRGHEPGAFGIDPKDYFM